MDYQLIYKLILIFLYSSFATYVATEYSIKKHMKYGYIAVDRYKRGIRKIPTMGGIAIFTGVLVSLALSQLLMTDIGSLFIFYFILIVYALYGVLDDLFAFRQRYDKIIVLFLLSLPIASLVHTTTIDIGFAAIDLGKFYLYFIAPLYIMVAANLINMHEGFNGLGTGLSLILLATIGIKSYQLYGVDKLIFLAPILGALLVFYPFNMYPAKILFGNSGAFMTGGAIGALLIINNLELFGIFILIPHIINFLGDTWTIVIKKIPDVKFGTLRKDGTIIAPRPMRYKSIKFFLTYHFRLREWQAVIVSYCITLIFCVLGVWLL